MTTLAGYVHWQLTGQRVLGVGDASGMFPIDSKTNGYHGGMLATFKELAGFDIGKVLPKALGAGENAGTLTDAGAKLLDPTGVIKPGIPVCPPEGDAGTGMVATNSVTRRTGNVSAGTSIFLMAVLEKALSKVYPEIDIVATPAGLPVAMIHCNNCTTDLDAWVRLFGEALAASGVHPDKGSLYDTLYAKAMDAEPDCGGMVSFNYYSGEHMTGFAEGRPLFVRMPDSRLTLANFMRSQIYAAMATLKIGMDILTQQEHIEIDRLLGHGGLFKTEHVGQALMASALGIPVTVMKSAGEGGAWGIALLAAFAADGGAQTLEEFVDNVFAGAKGTCVQPNEKDGAGFAAYLRRYVAGLQVERAAVECLR
jgi:sugar (pentulose or hexulose) kinase